MIRTHDQDARGLERAGVAGRQTGVGADRALEVHVAALGRKRVGGKIFRQQRGVAQPRDRQLAGHGADLLLNEAAGHLEGGSIQIRGNLLHDPAPDGFGQILLLGGGELRIFVITCPAGTGVIRCVAGEPYVVVGVGGTGLARDGSCAEVHGGTGALRDDILHG